MTRHENLRVHYRGLPPSEAVTAFVETQFAHLISLIQRQSMIHGAVTIEMVRPRDLDGDGCYRVVVEVNLPGKRIVVGRGEGRREVEHRNAYQALADAFHAMERRLATHTARQRHDVKHHEPREQTGTVVRLMVDEGYGFLTTDTGREVYFHENAVGGPGFEKLELGSVVRFQEEVGDEGPQASMVRPTNTQQPPARLWIVGA